MSDFLLNLVRRGAGLDFPEALVQPDRAPVHTDPIDLDQTPDSPDIVEQISDGPSTGAAAPVSQAAAPVMPAPAQPPAAPTAVQRSPAATPVAAGPPAIAAPAHPTTSDATSVVRETAAAEVTQGEVDSSGGTSASVAPPLIEPAPVASPRTDRAAVAPLSPPPATDPAPTVMPAETRDSAAAERQEASIEPTGPPRTSTLAPAPSDVHQRFGQHDPFEPHDEPIRRRSEPSRVEPAPVDRGEPHQALPQPATHDDRETVTAEREPSRELVVEPRGRPVIRVAERDQPAPTVVPVKADAAPASTAVRPALEPPPLIPASSAPGRSGMAPPATTPRPESAPPTDVVTETRDAGKPLPRDASQTVVLPGPPTDRRRPIPAQTTVDVPPPPRPTVNVRIGTVEIRATAPVSAGPPPATRRSAEPIGFDKYLPLRSYSTRTDV